MNPKHGMEPDGRSLSGIEQDGIEPDDTEWMKREMEFVDRVTRIVRLLTWTAMLAAAVLVVWILAAFVSGPARAGDPAAIAGELGRAGQAAAGAIARDSSQATGVPGYAGTALPERSHTAAGMEDAARRVLADPGDSGGAAGRAVIEGAVSRPASPGLCRAMPAVRRAKTIAADPQAPALGAAGIASGSVSDCKAEVADADDGGACGSVTWCVGAGCETVETPANTGFANAASRLNMALEMGGDGFDRESLRIFTGERRACRIQWGGLANCCKNSGLLSGLAGCTEGERLLAGERHAGNTHYLGTRCTKKIFGVCLRRERAWCVFGSRLGRILHEGARPQLGIGWGSCRGFTVAEIERIDFARVDVSEFTENLVEEAREPGISLPGAGETQAVMRGRIRDFYTRNQ